jgi:hypothetical protein
MRNDGNQRGKIMNVKITPEERAVLRRLGKKSRKETEKRLGKDYLIAQAQAQGKHGKKGGRPPVYPACVVDGKAQPRHRFYRGKCSLCGIPQSK